jgi:hypothetical protein
MDDKSKVLIASIEEAIKSLAQETNQKRQSSLFISYLDMMGKFHNYSFYNELLIAIQKPGATNVAGFKTWQTKFERSVKKGEKGIAILAPVLVKRNYQSGTKKDEDAEVVSSDTLADNLLSIRCVGFRTAYVFDVSQTEGKPLPEEPNWHDTEKDLAIEAALKAFADSKGIRVVEAEKLRGADGLSYGGLIKVLPKAGTRTLVHELAHELLHWKHPELKLSREIEEIEADSTAYVVAQYFHLKQDSEASPNYLALFETSSEDILARFTRICATSKEIIEAVESRKGLPDMEGAK